MLDVAGGVEEQSLEDPEERCLEEHADELAVEADAMQHLDDAVVRVHSVLLVLAKQ